MKKSILDRRIDILLERISGVKGVIKGQYRNTQPFRAVKVPDEERVAQYMNITPQEEGKMRLEFGDDYDKFYKTPMDELVRRYQGG